jgi:hypothetical protein
LSSGIFQWELEYQPKTGTFLCRAMGSTIAHQSRAFRKPIQSPRQWNLSILEIQTHKDSTSQGLPESEPESKSWKISARIKALKKKVNSSQRLHIDMEAAEAYKERHGKPPAKEQLKGKYYDIYPTADLDLVDEAIERVLKRYAKSS